MGRWLAAVMATVSVGSGLVLEAAAFPGMCEEASGCQSIHEMFGFVAAGVVSRAVDLTASGYISLTNAPYSFSWAVLLERVAVHTIAG